MKPKIKPRNPLVALARFRKAGSHEKPVKASRRTEKQILAEGTKPAPRTRGLKAVAMLAIAVGSLGGLPAHAAGPNMQPGLWEVTTKTEMPGMPMAMPPQTFKHCYRPEDVADSKKTVPMDKGCTLDQLTMSGNTASWKVSCKMDGQPMTGQGTITYSGQSYAGTSQMSGNMHGMAMKMNLSYSGRRIGECK